MHDLPPTDQELVEEAAKRNIEDWREAYDQYKEAKRTGGPCGICGWKDGDGIKTCFYSKEMGAVTHQNSDAGAMLSMTPKQASLFRLGHKLLYINAELREKHIQKVAWENVERRERHEQSYPDIPYRRDPDGNPVSDAEFIAKYRAEQEAQPLATEEPYRNWVHRPWWVPARDIPEALRGLTRPDDTFGTLTAYMVHCDEPHPDCGGMQRFVGPYHFCCTGCDTEVRLWEHGVDYDVG